MDSDTQMNQDSQLRIQQLENQLNQLMHQQPVQHTPAAAPKTIGKKPPEFDGKDRDFCATFLSHLALYFNTNSQAFPNDSSKVQFAATYLRGRAFRWFEPHLYTVDDRMLHDYGYFRQQLLENLGDPDRKRSLTRKIQRLTQTGSAATYSTEFFQVASMLDWNDESLKAQFYTGLKADVKDALALLPQDPANLQDMSNMAIRLDNRIHERRMEPNKPKQSVATVRHNPRNNTSTIGTTSNSATHPQVSHVTPMEVDGTSKHLSPSERKHRIEKNLCLYCGDSGHRRDTCPKRKNTPRANNVSATQTFNVSEPPTSQGKDTAQA